jgi:hypothetical protein
MEQDQRLFSGLCSTSSRLFYNSNVEASLLLHHCHPQRIPVTITVLPSGKQESYKDHWSWTKSSLCAHFFFPISLKTYMCYFLSLSVATCFKKKKKLIPFTKTGAITSKRLFKKSMLMNVLHERGRKPSHFTKHTII